MNSDFRRLWTEVSRQGFGHPRRMLMMVSRLVLARPAMQRLSRLLFEMSLHGMGILNYRSDRESGEAWFIDRLSGVALSGAGAPVVLDVGANEGNYTERLLKVMPRADIHAFEPHPRTAERLKARLNGRATVVAVAAGSSSGTFELADYVDDDGSSHASLYREVFTGIHKRAFITHTVPMRRLDEYLAGIGNPFVLLLKVDAEGHELEVLRGASSAIEEASIECIQFEFNEMNVISRSFLRDFFALLPEFELFRLLPRGVVPLRGEPLDEIFAFQNVVAVRRGSNLQSALRTNR